MSEEVQSSPTPRRRVKKSNGGAKPSSDSSTAESRDRRVERTVTGLRQSFVDVLAWGISVVWAIGFTVDMLNLFPKWDLPGPIWGLMTLVAGGSFIAPVVKKEDKE